MDRGDGMRTWISNTYTIGAMVLILTLQLMNWFWSRFQFRSKLKLKGRADRTTASYSSSVESGITSFISDSDMKLLLDDLEEKNHGNVNWENVIDKKSNHCSYFAKCCKPKGEPVKYLSITVFENCSAELVRDFYMDNEYRASWDKTLLEHEQLPVDPSSGIEIGRMVKKFALLSPREYVLAWKVWKDNDGTFYCLSKGCEHPFASSNKKYVRATFYRSGWRIRKVPGRNACEIKLVHQEAAGLNESFAKLAFAKGIWSYISKMDDALRRYSPVPTSRPTAPIQKADHSQSSTTEHQVARRCSMISRRPSKSVVKKGLILLGGAICLSRGHSNLATKVAMAYILTKISKRSVSTRQNKQNTNKQT